MTTPSTGRLMAQFQERFYSRTREEDKQRGTSKDLVRQSKKSPPKGSDDKHSRRSKKTRSDDDASTRDESGEGKSANLEAIKGLLCKKGSGTPLPKGSDKKEKKQRWLAGVRLRNPPRQSNTRRNVWLHFQLGSTRARTPKGLLAKRSLLPCCSYKHISTRMPRSSKSMARTLADPPLEKRPTSPVFKSSYAGILQFPAKGSLKMSTRKGDRRSEGQR